VWVSDVESAKMNPYFNQSLPSGYYTTLLMRNISHDILAISNSFAIAFKSPLGTYFGFSCANINSSSSRETALIKFTQDTYILWENNAWISDLFPSIPILSGEASIYNDDNGKLYIINYVTILSFSLYVVTLGMFQTAPSSVVTYKEGVKSYVLGPTSDNLLKQFNNYSILKSLAIITVISISNNSWFYYSVRGYNNYYFIVERNQVTTGGTTSSAERIEYQNLANYPYPDSISWYHVGFIKIKEINKKAILLGRLFNEQVTNKFDYLIYVVTIGSTGVEIMDISNWTCYYNIPSGITEVVGGDCWISPDSKWWFFISTSSTSIYTKGLYYVRAADNSVLFTETGFTNKLYVMSTNTDSVYQATKEYYILKVRFNSNSDKMMVLGNVSKGYFSDDTLTSETYIEGIQPDIIMCFMLDKSKKQWRQLSHTNVGLSGLWNNYAASASSSNTYKPFFNFINNETINFVYPGGAAPYTSYSYNLTWGE
jgi:hypothetical protein